MFDYVMVLGLDEPEDVPDSGTDAGGHQAAVGTWGAEKDIIRGLGTAYGVSARPLYSCAVIGSQLQQSEGPANIRMAARAATLLGSNRLCFYRLQFHWSVKNPNAVIPRRKNPLGLGASICFALTRCRGSYDEQDQSRPDSGAATKRSTVSIDVIRTLRFGSD